MTRGYVNRMSRHSEPLKMEEDEKGRKKTQKKTKSKNRSKRKGRKGGRAKKWRSKGKQRIRKMLDEEKETQRE